MKVKDFKIDKRVQSLLKTIEILHSIFKDENNFSESYPYETIVSLNIYEFEGLERMILTFFHPKTTESDRKIEVIKNMEKFKPFNQYRLNLIDKENVVKGLFLSWSIFLKQFNNLF